MVKLVDDNGVPLAQNYDISYSIQPGEYHQFTIGNVSKTIQELLGGSIPDWATLALFIPETVPIRYRTDGTPPTATVGFPIARNQPWPVQGKSALGALQFISQGGNAILSFELRG